MYLSEENNMIVYVEKKVLEDPAIVHDDSFGPVKKKFCTFREGRWPRAWGVRAPQLWWPCEGRGGRNGQCVVLPRL